MTEWEAQEADERSEVIEPDAVAPDADGTEAPAAGESEEQRSTGHAGVDEVLASLDRLDETPVEDHVGVFDSAHETLRRALTRAGDEPDPGRG